MARFRSNRAFQRPKEYWQAKQFVHATPLRQKVSHKTSHAPQAGDKPRKCVCHRLAFQNVSENLRSQATYAHLLALHWQAVVYPQIVEKAADNV